MYTELFNPIYGTVDGLPVIAVGVITFPGTEGVRESWIVVDADGGVAHRHLTDLVVDTRFRDGEWHDTSPGALDASE